MIVYINTKNNTIVQDFTFSAPLNQLVLKRGDTADVKIQFFSGRDKEVPVSSRNLVVGAKKVGEYDSDFILYGDSFTINTDDNYYELSLNVNTEALNALFNIDGDETNDVPFVELMFEVSWSDATDEWKSSNTISLLINNDIVRGTEATPTLSKSLSEWFEAEFSKQSFSLDVETAPISSEPANASFEVADTSIGEGDTITIGGLTYFFTEIPAADGDIPINVGDTTNDIAVKIASIVNGEDTYNIYNVTAHPDVVASEVSANYVTFLTKKHGTFDYPVVSSEFLTSASFFNIEFGGSINGTEGGFGQTALVGLEGAKTSYYVCTQSNDDLNIYQWKDVSTF